MSRVVREPTLIAKLEQQCQAARLGIGDAEPPVLCWIQLDDAREQRDQVGFTGLEKLMHAIHERIRVHLESGDLSARFGNRSIALLLERNPEQRAVSKMLDAMTRSVSTSLFEIGEQMIAATVSIAARGASDALRPAEMNLVKVARLGEALSEKGGNRAQFDTASDTTERSPGMLLVQLNRALKKNELHVVQQPLLATNGPEKNRLQLLPRLKGTNGELIPAARFVPVAAERGVLPALDRWMIHYALQMLKKHIEAETEPPVLFVNQSPALVDQPDMLKWLTLKLKSLQLPRRQIVFEFSVIELKPRIREAVEVLNQLGRLGVGISLSGMDEKVPEVVVLKHLPCDYLRMRPGFARLLVQDEALADRFGEFAKRAHAAGRKLIVPMLEDAEEVTRIWQMDVDLIQGNFIQQPVEQSA